MVEEIETENPGIEFVAATPQRLSRAVQAAVEILRMNPAIKVAGENTMQEVPLARSFLPDIEIATIMQEVCIAALMREAVNNVAL